MKLLVLVLRGLGAAHTGPHGNRWIDTSALNALAADGIVFDTHLAAHPDAEGAAWAWRTGCHRFPGAPGFDQPEAQATGPTSDLLALLRGRGVRTWLVRDTSRPGAASFAEGWDSVDHCQGLDAVM